MAARSINSICLKIWKQPLSYNVISAYRVYGIIIKRHNFGEADKILTILAKKRGKIRAIAKGIRKIKSRRAPHLELFNYSTMTLHKGKGLDIVVEAETLNNYMVVKKNLNKISLVYYFAELIDKLCPDNFEIDHIIDMFLKKLNILNTPEFYSIAEQMDSFALEVLTNLGYLAEKSNLKGDELRSFIENIIEKKLKTTGLLTNNTG